MDLASSFKMLATYNQRMNEQLIAVCQQLTAEQLQKETHSFFPTVMDYWNHILFGDLIMLQRLVANNIVVLDTATAERLPIAKGIHDTFVDDLLSLKTLRHTLDHAYISMTRDFDTNTFDKKIHYITTEGQAIEKNVGEFCQHIFNHQTHHRGQLTCLLSQFGLDFGCTDLPMIVPEGSYIQ
ncbi:DinB family protein [Vibrio genomosp. F10]|uniref:DinB family protein n=1 Tax=Vibrio genomosp. F10 TaxID=723171 RepID=UPI0002EB1945|nr:DinB family protein [Vibrio genomosp. F10]OEF06269.1 damage-inducible protein DinB [Vibrio genomosp. F10 str. 9ZD137]